jgi:predicted short-subunit dehydrogenase-like oxidoreductase (DUF2520 family)
LLNNTIYTEQISIVGAGNMAWHLAHAFTKAGIAIDTIIGRNISKAEELANCIGTKFSSDTGFSSSKRQILFLAISDSSVADAITKFNSGNNILVHTSGSVDVNIFNGKVSGYGVFYPFQTLTKGVETDFARIPIFIEASDEKTLQTLHFLALKISNYVVEMESEQRQILHLSGIILNNFTNHLAALAFDYLDKNKIDKNFALPLLQETIRKIDIAGPYESQTGPARRKNVDVLEKHFALLKDDLPLKNLYKVISDSIIAYYSR